MKARRIVARKLICLSRACVLVVFGLAAGNAHAIPALQLGPGTSGGWSYDSGDDTWFTTSTSFSLTAYANALTSDGGNGAFAWDTAGASTRYAYLVVGLVPDLGSVTDGFDLSINGDGGALTLVTSGYGDPPLNDDNSLAPHGVYDTYFEIYEFSFDGALTDIFDTQPGGTGTGKGYAETFDITINSLVMGALGVHFDLYTVGGDGLYSAAAASDKKLVNAFAPFSHDAAYVVPLPATFWLFSTALIGFIGISRRRTV